MSLFLSPSLSPSKDILTLYFPNKMGLNLSNLSALQMSKEKKRLVYLVLVSCLVELGYIIYMLVDVST